MDLGANDSAHSCWPRVIGLPWAFGHERLGKAGLLEGEGGDGGPLWSPL